MKDYLTGFIAAMVVGIGAVSLYTPAISGVAVPEHVGGHFNEAALVETGRVDRETRKCSIEPEEYFALDVLCFYVPNYHVEYVIDDTVCYMDSTYPGVWLSDYTDDGLCHFGEDN